VSEVLALEHHVGILPAPRPGLRHGGEGDLLANHLFAEIFSGLISERLVQVVFGVPA